MNKKLTVTFCNKLKKKKTIYKNKSIKEKFI